MTKLKKQVRIAKAEAILLGHSIGRTIFLADGSSQFLCRDCFETFRVTNAGIELSSHEPCTQNKKPITPRDAVALAFGIRL